jgi:hypothetical protein
MRIKFNFRWHSSYMQTFNLAISSNSTYEFFPWTRLHVISVWVSVLQSVPALCKQGCSIKQVLPINPST